MTGNKILLDTNVVIEIFKSNGSVIEIIESYTRNINTVTLGELQVGVYRVANKAVHEKLLNDFLTTSSILLVNEATAAVYGEMSAALYKKGKPIPTNDIWIAATAKQYNLTLFTKDKHFSEIEGIDVQFL